MARVIVVTSGKGGVGKSTLTASIGRVLAARGYKVALVDADFGLNNLDVLLGVESKVVYDVVDVAENRCRALQALVNADENGLRLLAAAHTYDESRVDGQSLKVIVNSLSPRFDFIFIDSPAGIEKGFRRAVVAATEAIVVTTPHLSALRDADKTLGLVAAYGIKKRGIVVNRIRGDMSISGESVSVDEIGRALGAEIAGVIPDDDGINLLSVLSSPPKRRSEGEKALLLTAARIATGKGEIYDPESRYRGLLGVIKSKIKRFV